MKEELTKKLSAVQMALKAPKSKFNEFGNFNFRSAEDILESVKPLLSEQGLVLTISDEMVAIGDRYYIKATVTLTDGNDSISVTAYAREDESRPGMSESQCTGCSSSYARKYALNGLFCIDDGTDSDSFNNRRQPKTQPAQTKSNAEIIKEFCAEKKNEEGVNLKELKSFYEFYTERADDWKGKMDAERLFSRWIETAKNK